MKLGARMIKTGVSVTLSLYIAMIFNLQPIVFAAVAAVLSIQPSIYRSWQHIIEQLQANFIGVILAISFTYFLGNEPFIVGLVVILVIAINIQLKIEKSIPLAVVTVIVIMESATGSFSIFALERFLLILIGIGSSFVVNTIFLPPRYEDRLYAQINQLSQDILAYLRVTAPNELDDQRLRQEIQRLKAVLTEIEQLYLLYKEERTYFRKVKYSKIRKLVIFRQMIRSVVKALSLLRKIEEQQAELQTLPAELKKSVQEEIEQLANYHEKILLKYEGKIKANHQQQEPTNYAESRKLMIAKFMELYHEQQGENQEEWMSNLLVVSLIMDYSVQLEHLDKLVRSYHSFHQQNDKR